MADVIWGICLVTFARHVALDIIYKRIPVDATRQDRRVTHFIPEWVQMLQLLWLRVALTTSRATSPPSHVMNI